MKRNQIRVFTMGLLDIFKQKASSEKKEVALVFVDAENAQAQPDSIKESIENHFGASAKHMYSYSKWSANSPSSKKYRNAGFRLVQADTGDNNADIMMCLDAYEEVRDCSERGIDGIAYICFHGDRGFTHLMEKIKAVSGWKSVWVTSNKKQIKMIQNSASEVLTIPISTNESKKVVSKSTTVSKPKKTTTISTTVSKPKKEVAGKFPSIALVNTSKGMRLPSQPSDYVQIIDWAISNSDKYSNKSDCVNMLKETGIIVKSRCDSAIHFILKGALLDGDYTECSNILSAIERTTLYKQIEDVCLKTLAAQNHTEIRDGVKEYFAEIKRLISLGNSSPTTYDEDIIQGSNFISGTWPVTKGLNDSAKGLRLPSQPCQFVDVLNWFISNYNNYPTYAECRDALKETDLIPRSRVVRCLTVIIRGYSPNGIYEIDSDQFATYNASTFCENIRDNCLGKRGFELEMHSSPNFISAIERYFAEVKRLI